MLCAVNLLLNFAWHVYSCVLKMADPIKTRCFVDYASGSGGGLAQVVTMGEIVEGIC